MRSRQHGVGVNADVATVDGFGAEWQRFDQSELNDAESRRIVGEYFSLMPLASLPPGAAGMDVGCGSGRWARLVAEEVGTLHAVDASAEALDVARRNLASFTNVEFHNNSVDSLPCDDNSLDFVYSLGVLHHVPDTAAGIQACVRKLKPGAPFLVYLYYALDNRPAWFRGLWKVSDGLRRRVSALNPRPRALVAEVIAATVYWPLARLSLLAEKVGINPAPFPLSAYRSHSFYTLRTDALDRFGTKLEQRFTRSEIDAMMSDAGLENIRFRDESAFWCAVGTKAFA
jgi:ubiquinone/menaquinone biosynthesis C-methylase UbiE